MKRKLVVLLLLIFSDFANAERPVLSAAKYGLIKFGDSLVHAENLLGEKTHKAMTPDETTCYQVQFRVYPNVFFMVEEGLITRAESSVAIRTANGVTVGTSIAAIEKRIPSVLVVPHQYDPDGHYLIFKTRNGKAALVMEEGNGKVTNVRGGLEPSVEYVEGCL